MVLELGLEGRSLGTLPFVLLDVPSDHPPVLFVLERELSGRKL